MEKRNSLAQDLETYLKKTGLPLYQLAPIVGVTFQTLYNIRKGREYHSRTEKKIRKIIDRIA